MHGPHALSSHYTRTTASFYCIDSQETMNEWRGVYNHAARSECALLHHNNTTTTTTHNIFDTTATVQSCMSHSPLSTLPPEHTYYSIHNAYATPMTPAATARATLPPARTAPLAGEVEDGFTADVIVAIVPEGAVDVGGTVSVEEGGAEVALGVTPEDEDAEGALTLDAAALEGEWLPELGCEDSEGDEDPEWEEEPVVVGLWEPVEVVAELEWLDEPEECDDDDDECAEEVVEVELVVEPQNEAWSASAVWMSCAVQFASRHWRMAC